MLLFGFKVTPGRIRPHGLDRFNENNNKNNADNNFLVLLQFIGLFPKFRNHSMKSDIEFGPVGKLNPLHYSPLCSC